jgi:hypothetical protein
MTNRPGEAIEFTTGPSSFDRDAHATVSGVNDVRTAENDVLAPNPARQERLVSIMRATHRAGSLTPKPPASLECGARRPSLVATRGSRPRSSPLPPALSNLR